MDKTLSTILKDLALDPSVLVQQAEGGDHIAARELIVRAAKEIDEGRLNDPALRRFIAQSLTAVLAGKTAIRSFRLTKKRGAKPKHSAEFEELIVQSMIDEGISRSKAESKNGNTGGYLRVAKKIGTSANTVEEYYKKFASKIEEAQRIQDEFRQEDNRE